MTSSGAFMVATAPGLWLSAPESISRSLAAFLRVGEDDTAWSASGLQEVVESIWVVKGRGYWARGLGGLQVLWKDDLRRFHGCNRLLAIGKCARVNLPFFGCLCEGGGEGYCPERVRAAGKGGKHLGG